MAFRITIEKVDKGATDNGSFTLFTYVQAPLQPDILPVELIVDEGTGAAGITANQLKKFLTIVDKGLLTIPSSAVPASTSLGSKIDSTYQELNP